MAKVILELKVMPSDVSIDLAELEEKIRQKLKIDRISREPIAFGLVALHLTTIVEDEAGEIENIEKTLKTIDGVGQVEVVSLSRAYI